MHEWILRESLGKAQAITASRAWTTLRDSRILVVPSRTFLRYLQRRSPAGLGDDEPAPSVAVTCWIGAVGSREVV